MALRQPLILKPRKIVVTIFIFESLSPWTLSFIGSVTGYFTLCRSPGTGHTFWCKAPVCWGGGGQSDTHMIK